MAWRIPAGRQPGARRVRLAVSTLVCIPITVHDEASALADADAARAAGAELVEFRIDEFFSGVESGASDSERGAGARGEIDAIVRLVARSPLACIVTCRPTSEGGAYDGPEAARIALFERLGTAFGPGEHPPRYIDIELAALERSANLRQKVRLAVAHPEQIRDLQTSLIVSLHDFKGRPADLSRRVAAMRREPAAAVLKVAFRARSIRDNLEILDLLGQRDRPTIALAMGEFGLLSRVLAPKFGGFLTFASLRPQSATAPGQPTVRDLLELYRFRSIGPATRVYGVVGWPVGHSISPRVHNAAFGATEHDGVYIPLPVPGARAATEEAEREPRMDHSGSDLEDAYVSLKATLLELIEHPGLDVAGLSVTIPHKEGLVRLARERGWTIDEEAGRIGAANTVVVERGGGGRVERVRILSTDAPALAACVAPVVGGAAGLAGKRIAILGAGGVGRAAAYALSRLGAEVSVFNRNAERAAALATDLAGREASGGTPVRGAGLDQLAAWRGEAVVNCTPVGMAGGHHPDASVIPTPVARALDPRETVIVDTVYNPIVTPMVRWALEGGFTVVDGLAIFLEQAARQFEAWTGQPAPRATMSRAARGALTRPSE